jgi:hypothetical protein
MITEEQARSLVRELRELGKFDKEGICPLCGRQVIGVTASETYYEQLAHIDEHEKKEGE